MVALMPGACGLAVGGKMEVSQDARATDKVDDALVLVRPGEPKRGEHASCRREKAVRYQQLSSRSSQRRQSLRWL